MTPAALLSDLAARGVDLWADAGTLRYRASVGVLSPADLDALRAHKPALLALLAEPLPADLDATATASDSDTPTTDPADDLEARLERAAILEYDGGLPRDEAERLAGLTAERTAAPTAARVAVRRHPCPPLPRNFRWRDTSPLAELDTDPDDTRIRCAYCRHWKPVQRHGRMRPWCSVKDDWEEPSTLHHCTAERFEFDPAHGWRRWLLPDGDDAGTER